jgi:hypothetical protein
MKPEMMEEIMAMEPERMFAMMPKMMEMCFSKFSNEQRRGILAMCRGQLDKMEAECLSPKT